VFFFWGGGGGGKGVKCLARRVPRLLVWNVRREAAVEERQARIQGWAIMGEFDREEGGCWGGEDGVISDRRDW